MNRARVALLLLPVVCVLARPAAGQWVKTYGRDTSDIPCSVRETPDGGLVLSGISKYTSTGATDAMSWVGRLTPGGDIKWWASLQGATLSDLYNDFNAVVPLDDGGFVLAATYREPSFGQSYLLAAKLDDGGRVVWQRLYGWPGAGPTDRLFRVAAVEASLDGGVLVAGAATTEVSGPWHLWVAKLDGAGNLLWQQAYPASMPGEAHALGQSAEGTIYVAGVSLAWGVGGYDYWVLKLDPAGRIIWQSTCGGPQNDVPRGLTATPDGGCLVVGESYSFGASPSQRDSWFVKFDATGRTDWQKLFPAAGEDWAEAVVATADGGFLVSGAAQRGPNTDAYLLKITAHGEAEWRKTFGSSSGFYKFSNESAVDIVELRGGAIAAVGQTSEMGAYANDVLVLKLTARGDADACAPSRDDTLSGTDTAAVPLITTAMESRTTAVLSPFAAPSLDVIWTTKPICPGKTKRGRR
ncbi:MAG: hypothetical protein OEW05_07265 [Candidatus Aminicenantes bacterium]|nr:hypothetical protein [Candidatus Aminicenantes bacterium]